jgi:hypothetical protein
MLVALCVDLFAIDSVPGGTERKKENGCWLCGFGDCGAKPGLASAGHPNNMNHHNDIDANPLITHSPLTTSNSILERQFMYKPCMATAVRSDKPQKIIAFDTLDTFYLQAH